MSENNPGLELPGYIIDFYKKYSRAPEPGEMLTHYYGEDIPPADFIIFSNKLSGHRAIPPFITSWKAKAYFFPVPGFLALSEGNYRRILYDLLFVQPEAAPAEYSDDSLEYLDRLGEFYKTHNNTIIGTGERINGFCVPDIGRFELNKN
jgi:hypothetical protein